MDSLAGQLAGCSRAGEVTAHSAADPADAASSKIDVDQRPGRKRPMRTEKEKMQAGELYDALDPELAQARDRARDLCRDLNATREKDQEPRRRLVTALFGKGGETVWLQPPFFCDYGWNILLGERV